jgi:hypothetical protein
VRSRGKAVANSDQQYSPRDVPWVDGLEDDPFDDEEEQEKDTRRLVQKRFDPQRKAIFQAAQSYLQHPVKLKNIAHSVQPIRLGEDWNGPHAPKLEVDLIVCPHEEGSTETNDTDRESKASIQLIRMVNHIPLLDGAEATACGLVHGISNKTVWGSFGLHVTKSSDSDMHSWTPQFDVRDSDQVAPFLQSQTHRLWEARNEQEEPEDETEAKKRKHAMFSRSSMLPAKVRLGCIVVVVKIRAAPSSLPLPTLSKVRESIRLVPCFCLAESVALQC